MFGVDLHHQPQTYHLSQAPSCDPVHNLSRTFIPKKKQAAMIGEGGSIISREPALVSSSPELLVPSGVLVSAEIGGAGSVPCRNSLLESRFLECRACFWPPNRRAPLRQEACTFGLAAAPSAS